MDGYTCALIRKLKLNGGNVLSFRGRPASWLVLLVVVFEIGARSMDDVGFFDASPI